jgi:hypothetical protein
VHDLEIYKICVYIWGYINDYFLSSFILLSTTNKMQRYTVFFITVNALHVSGGSPAHHQELKTVHTASGTCQACLLLPLSWLRWNKFQLNHASGNSKQAWHVPDAMCTVLEFLMMGGGTDRNM